MTGALIGCGALALGCAAAGLLVRRASSLAHLHAAQGVALASGAIAEGAAMGETSLALLAGALLAAKAMLTTIGLARIAASTGDAPLPVRPARDRWAPVAWAVAASALVVAAIATARQVPLAAGPLDPDALMMVLGLVLLGPLLAVARPDAPGPLAGALSVEAGAALAAIALSPAMAIVECAVAGAALATMVAMLQMPDDEPLSRAEENSR